MTVYAKLLAVQMELKAPKNQYNSFGKYNYRSCEDILEAVKPLCKKHNVVLTLGDNVVAVNDRVYIQAVATFVDIETGEKIVNTASAREEETKKGMDAMQITGCASSYARKYCLNGLFDIDDTKDADTDVYTNIQKSSEHSKPAEKAEKQWVRKQNGCTEVLGNNNQWYNLETMSIEALNKIANDKKYADCHAECREIMVRKSQ